MKDGSMRNPIRIALVVAAAATLVYAVNHSMAGTPCDGRRFVE
jgi:hypothetical protein